MSKQSSVNSSTNEASRRMQTQDLKLPLALPALKGIVIESMDSPNPEGRRTKEEQFIVSQELSARSSHLSAKKKELEGLEFKQDSTKASPLMEFPKPTLKMGISAISVSNAEEDENQSSLGCPPNFKDSPDRDTVASPRHASLTIFNQNSDLPNQTGELSSRPGPIDRRSSRRSSIAIVPPADDETPREKAKQQSEFERIKAILQEIRRKKNMENELKLKTLRVNDADVFRQRLRLGTEIQYLQRKLVTDAKQTFRYIKGHDKQEAAPGQLLMDEQATYNIQNRIIVPSQRLQNCQDAITGLQQSGEKFQKFLKDFKQLRADDPDKEEVKKSNKSKVKAIPLDEACMNMLNIKPNKRRRLSARRVSSRYLSSSLSNRPPPLGRSISLYQPRPSIHTNMIGSPYLTHQDGQGHLALPPSAVLPNCQDDQISPQRRMTLDMKKGRKSSSRLTRMKTTENEQLLSISPRLVKRQQQEDSFGTSSLSQIKEDNESGVSPLKAVTYIKAVEPEGKSDVAEQLSKLSGDTPREKSSSSSSSSNAASVSGGEDGVIDLASFAPTKQEGGGNTEPTPPQSKQQINKQIEFKTKLTGFDTQPTEGDEVVKHKTVALPTMLSQSPTRKSWKQSHRISLTSREMAVELSASQSKGKMCDLRLKRLRNLESLPFKPVEPTADISDPQNYVIYQQKMVTRQGRSTKRNHRAKNLIFSPRASKLSKETFSLLSPNTTFSPKPFPQYVPDSLTKLHATRGRTRGVDIPDNGRFPMISKTTVVSGQSSAFPTGFPTGMPNSNQVSLLNSVDNSLEFPRGFGGSSTEREPKMPSVKIKKFRRNVYKEEPYKLSPLNTARLYARYNQRTLQKMKQPTTARTNNGQQMELASVRQPKEMQQCVMTTTLSSSRGDTKNSQAVLGSTLCESPASPFKKVKTARLAKLSQISSRIVKPERVMLKNRRISDHV